MNVNAIDTTSLNVEMKLFLSLYHCADACGRIELSKDSLARCLNVSRQTVGRYLSILCAAKMIKYKYSGKGMFNPTFYLKNAPTYIQTAYDKFKSDM